jgi:hypothetical protein
VNPGVRHGAVWHFCMFKNVRVKKPRVRRGGRKKARPQGTGFEPLACAAFGVVLTSASR